MLGWAGAGVMLIGIVMMLVHQAEMFWDARSSVDSTKATIVASVAKVDETKEELKVGLVQLLNRQMTMEKTLAEAESRFQDARLAAEAKMLAFTLEQKKLKNTIAPRQINPKLAAAGAAKPYDGAALREELDRLKKRYKTLRKKSK